MMPRVHLSIAFLVFCHGFIYIRIGSALPQPVSWGRNTSNQV